MTSLSERLRSQCGQSLCRTAADRIDQLQYALSATTSMLEVYAVDDVEKEGKVPTGTIRLILKTARELLEPERRDLSEFEGM